MSIINKMFFVLVFGLFILPGCGGSEVDTAESNDELTSGGSAFKAPLCDLFRGIPLNHTYYCTNGLSDCYTIKGKCPLYGGTKMNESYGTVNDSQRCVAGKRGCNCSSCYMVYAINGVCHQHTNRGVNSWGKGINFSSLSGGSLSYTVFGAFGLGFSTCKSWANSQCGL